MWASKDRRGAWAAGDDGPGLVSSLAPGGGGSQLLARAVSWGWSGWQLPSSPLLRCLAAMEALTGQGRRRHGQVRSWRLANLITGGRLLSTNMTSPLAAREACFWISAKSKQEVPSGP